MQPSPWTAQAVIAGSVGSASVGRGAAISVAAITSTATSARAVTPVFIQSYDHLEEDRALSGDRGERKRYSRDHPVQFVKAGLDLHSVGHLSAPSVSTASRRFLAETRQISRDLLPYTAAAVKDA